jgi:hypothetical protein
MSMQKKDPVPLQVKLVAIDGGRFAPLINTLDINESCEKCSHFNPNIDDPAQAYRCRVMPRCIAATLSKELQSYLWVKLGWRKPCS